MAYSSPFAESMTNLVYQHRDSHMHDGWTTRIRISSGTSRGECLISMRMCVEQDHPDRDGRHYPNHWSTFSVEWPRTSRLWWSLLAAASSRLSQPDRFMCTLIRSGLQLLPSAKKINGTRKCTAITEWLNCPWVTFSYCHKDCGSAATLSNHWSAQ